LTTAVCYKCKYV